MSWHVIRKGTDHTKFVEEILKDYLSTNWSLTGDLQYVLFSTGWYNENFPYQIHIRHDIDKSPIFKTLGNKPIHKYDDVVQVHTFCNEQTDNVLQSNLGKMTREIQRIIGSDVAGLATSEGIYSMNCSTANVLPLEDSQTTIYHAVQRVGMMYAKRYA